MIFYFLDVVDIIIKFYVIMNNHSTQRTNDNYNFLRVRISD